MQQTFQPLAMIQITYHQLEQTISQVIADLPEQFSRLANQTIIEIQELPEQQMLQQLGLTDPYCLLGMYTGVPLPRRSVLHSGQLPDRVILFKTNLQRLSSSMDQLQTNIRKTLLHELGHVMGLSDRQLRKLGY